MQSILERLKENKKITAIANIALTTITNKNISPDIDLIKELKARYDSKLQKEVQDIPLKVRVRDNPLFRLSIEDFENICKDESIKVIIARALNITIKNITVFCKYVKIFTDNIDSSPNTIKEKMKIKKIAMEDLIPELLNGKKTEPLRLNHLPEDILKHITQKSLKSLFKYKLKKGIPVAKLDFKYLSANPNAFDFLSSPENRDFINYSQLSKNTNLKAIELLKAELIVNPNNPNIDWRYLSANPDAFEILKAYQDKIDYKWLSFNTDPNAIELLKERIQINRDDINWTALSKNPNAIELLKANRDKIDWNLLAGNQSAEAIELLEEEIRINPKNISWNNLSGNPIPRAIELLEENPIKIVWGFLTSNTNPRAIKLLKDNEDKIVWSSLSQNPSAIALLKDRILYENNLPEDVYKALKVYEKINWKNISENPNAIELLKKRIIYEANLPEDVLKALKIHEKINWEKLSENFSIFSRI